MSNNNWNCFTHLLYGKIGTMCLIILLISTFLILKIMNISNEKSYEIFSSEIVPLSVVKSLKLSNANKLTNLMNLNIYMEISIYLLFLKLS